MDPWLEGFLTGLMIGTFFVCVSMAFVNFRVMLEENDVERRDE